MKNTKLFALIMCFCLIFTMVASAVPENSAAATGPVVTSANYILVNMDTGEVLVEKNSSERKYPASTTKIMTALLALEKLDPEGTSTVSNEAVMSISWDSSKLGLYEGETFNNFELIKGMMVVSGNDAANVLAEAVSGSISDFVALMNEKAKSLGCEGTHFVNTHGLTDENHYTTVADMAKIAVAAMKNPAFREIVKSTYFELPKTEKCDVVRSFNTTNNLITNARTSDYLYSPATGIKTGYTDAAKNCLVASAEKEGVRLISVILGASVVDGVNTAYSDTKALMEWGFENYVSRQIIKKGEFYDEKSIKYAKGAKTVKLAAKEDFSFVFHKNVDEDLITTKVTVDTPVLAPVTPDDELGKIEVFYGDEYLGETILTADKVYEYSWWSAFVGVIGKIIGIAFLAVLAVVAVLIIVRQVEYEKRKKERMRSRGSERR
ncbi:MAG: D-alanyl-D-alanine carboxypeptidase [Clostridia bacterium]|nr:D-alanyl-D-alanine carboxypeptidase [Clostridia bacterium]